MFPIVRSSVFHMLFSFIVLCSLLGSTLVIAPVSSARGRANPRMAETSIAEDKSLREPLPFRFSGTIDGSRDWTDTFRRIHQSAKTAANVVSEFVTAVSKGGVVRAESADGEDSSVENDNGSELMTLSTATITHDYDGDGMADVGTWRVSQTEFKVRKSSNGSLQTATIGASGAVAAPGDYDGDGKTDAAVFNAGSWTIKKSSDNSTVTVSYGASGDIPASGDYDSDGITDLAVFRPSTSTWWVRHSSDSSSNSTSWGATGDIPIPGDFDGDGQTDFAVYRPSAGSFYLLQSKEGTRSVSWGLASDIPIQGDFDGDGKDDPVVFRPSEGVWWVLKSTTDYATYTGTSWGNWGDQPAPADYDGDGITDHCIWRPATGVWHILKSSDQEHEFYTLGVSGDVAAPSAYTKQIGASVSGDVIAEARLDAVNAVGGTNLYSQNFGWGTQLAGLPGRSGLNAGIGISYNSLVWLKVGSAMYFDPDRSNVTPGFRLGYSVIEPAYYDTTRSAWVYMMVTPSGGRVEFRQTAVSNIYETVDSGYTRLTTQGATNPNDPVEDITIKVATTDGTVTSYEWKAGAFRVSQIKDSNGNYVTATHSSAGLLTKITDTLGREINVNYSGTLDPVSITQSWRASNGSGSTTTHTWATFAYTTKTVDTDFGGGITNVFGPPDSSVIKVLDKITYADGSSTKFEYNGYLQVKKVSNIAADSPSHILNYVSTNLASPAAGQTDCPRVSEVRSWTENFNQDTYGVEQEVVATMTRTTGSSYSLPGSISGTATKIDVGVTGHPDGLISRNYFIESGWGKGLPVATEDCVNGSCSGSDRKRWTWTDWRQDIYGGTPTSYPLNPRVVETRVGDGTNTKRTTVEYFEIAGLGMSDEVSLYGLVKEVKLFDSDLTTVLKKSEIEYNLNSAYTSRRIIGLPAKVQSYGLDSTGFNLTSKATFAYDEGDFSDSALQQNISPVQQDATNYGSGFVVGRGNRTSVTRWDATAPTNSSLAITSSTKYNTAGSPVAHISPWDGTNTRTVRIGYADNFNSSPGVSTFAYPTVISDPAASSLGDASHSSFVKYRYDIGANVEAVSPAPAGQSHGKTTKRIFDSIGRLDKQSVYVNTIEQSYTRYEYPTSGIHSKTYSTIVDTNSNGPDTADEVLSESWTDGAGRVRFSRVPHTFSGGSTATWAGTAVEYDMLGRVTRQSVPTEVNGSFEPTGDDVSRGWLWNKQEYDWMGRTTRTIPTDSNGSDGKDSLISYEGCGCAGGLVTTVQGPLVPRDDDPNTNARRTVKSYADILGREFKTETFEWNGSTVYSSMLNTFNGRDQVTLSRQFAGTTSSTNYQDTTASYDGYGRVVSRRSPQQDAETATQYIYNLDNSIQSITDARGATVYNTYNSRGLVTHVGWTAPGESEIEIPHDVNFSYDDLGNRTQMTDGQGTQTYVYDSLSRLTSESRQFNEDFVGEAPQGNRTFTIGYTYGLAGQLTSLTEPYGVTVNYGQDILGRLTSVAPSTTFGGVSTFASNAQYRAWGALKHLEYSNGVEMDQTFDDALRSSNYKLGTSTVDLMDKSYEYYKDDSLKLVDDNLDWKFDRLNRYDHQGRLTKGRSSLEATGGTVSNEFTERPYLQDYQYNAFGDMTERKNGIWTNGQITHSYTFAEHRISGWTYDADGRVTHTAHPEPVAESKYNAAGKLSYIHDKNELDIHEDKTHLYYDGDGQKIRQIANQCRILEPGDPEETCEWLNPELWGGNYYVRSTVLGGEVIVDGRKRYVYAGGTRLAELTYRLEFPGGPTGVAYDAVQYYHNDAAGVSQRVTRNSPEDLLGVPSYNPNYIDPRQNEYDTFGTNVGLVSQQLQQPSAPADPPIPYDGDAYVYVDGLKMKIYQDGVPMSWQALGMLGLGGVLGMQVYDKFGRPIHGVYSPVEMVNGDLYWESRASARGRWDGNTFYPKSIAIDTTSISWGLSDNRGGSRIQHPGQRLRRKESFHQNARDHLKAVPDCAKFIESLLSQLQKDSGVNLEGDIYYFIDQMELFGTLNTDYAGDAPGGGVMMAGGNAHQVDYGQEGWGFNLWYSINSESNAVTYLGELIHSIGRRNGKSHFSDSAGATALENMGLAMNRFEYQMTDRAQRLRARYPIYVNKDTGYFGPADSDLFHSIIKYHCARKPERQSKPEGAI